MNMLDDLLELLYRFPGTARAFGAALYSVGGFALVCGAYAEVATFAASVATGMAGHAPVAQVAQLLPGIWTWWIPESVYGAVFYTVLVSAGTALALTAKQVERQLRTM